MASDSHHFVEYLYYASWYGRDSEVLDLLQRGADPNSYYLGRTSLMMACELNHLLTSQLLIKWGANLNKTVTEVSGVRGWTALHFACYKNSMGCVGVLMDHHSPPDIKDYIGRTAVDLARKEGYNDIVEYVTTYKPLPKDPLSSYPSVKLLSQLKVKEWFKLGHHFGLTEDQMESIKNSDNPTKATLVAAKVKNIDLKWKDIVEGLLTIGEYELADRVCTEQGEGLSVLSVSAFYGWLDMIRYLVDTVGIDPRKPVNQAGDTLVCIACTRGHIDVIDYLLKDKGCDPDGPVNAAGDTLRSLATSQGLSKVIEYLDNLSADSAADILL